MYILYEHLESKSHFEFSSWSTAKILGVSFVVYIIEQKQMKERI